MNIIGYCSLALSLLAAVPAVHAEEDAAGMKKRNADSVENASRIPKKKSELVKENLKLTALQDRARVVEGDAMAFLQSLKERFDIVLLDPPYDAGLLEPAIRCLTAFDILNPHGIIVAEHPAGSPPPAVQPPYQVRRTYRYGRIGLTMIRRSGDQKNEG